MSVSSGNEPKAAPVIKLIDFFERTPPGTWAIVEDVATPRLATTPPSIYSSLHQPELPDIELHCESCDGQRTFATRSEFSVAEGKSEQLFVCYVCRNCRRKAKTYAVWAQRRSGEGGARLFKFGENPSFGPPLPSKLIQLIRPEWEYFQKGRRAENQGLGIGSFAYYRRVIESQKNRILDEVIKAANKLAAPPELIKELEQAKREIKFKKALEGVKHGLPQALLIEGSNPLTLLHSALSIGLHAKTDEECLATATDIRIIMTDLAERLASVLKDESELKNAVARLLKASNSS